MSRWRPNLSKDLEDEITAIFGKSPQVKRKYTGSKTKFLEDAIRRLILYYEEKYGLEEEKKD